MRLRVISQVFGIIESIQSTSGFKLGIFSVSECDVYSTWLTIFQRVRVKYRPICNGNFHRGRIGMNEFSNKARQKYVSGE